MVGIISAVFVGTAAAQPRGLRLIPATTDAMGEAVPIGSLAVTMPSTTYVAGDIVSYEAGDASVRSARVIARLMNGTSETQYRLKFDQADMAQLQPLPEQAILGRVEIVIPLAGYALNAIRTPIGLSLGVVLPLAAGIASLIIDARRRWRAALYESTFYPGPGFSTDRSA